MTTIKLKRPYRREKPDARRADVLEAALRMARNVGAQGLVRDRIAEEAGVCSSLLHRYFGSMDNMRDIIIREAFDRNDVDILYRSLSIEDFKRLNNNPALTDKLCAFLRS
jgi:DNA-binding transcriptional regulator YbjK